MQGDNSFIAEKRFQQPQFYAKRTAPAVKVPPIYAAGLFLTQPSSDSTHAGYGQQKNCHQFCQRMQPNIPVVTIKVHQYQSRGMSDSDARALILGYQHT